MPSKIAVLILAGGNSSRFDGCKLLAQYQGRPLLSYSLDIAKELAAKDVYLLTGAWHDKLLQEDNHSSLLAGIHLIHHQQWQQGMGSSIAKGFTHFSADYDAVLIMLADQPLIKLADYQHLLAQLKLDSGNSPDISCSLYANKRGVPAVFKHTCFAALMQLQGEQGAKALLYDPHYQTVESSLAAGAIDIDSKDDLFKLNADI